METLSNSVNLAAPKRRSLVPSEWETEVRLLGSSEYSEAGRSLAHSFAGDALSQYLLDGDDMAGYSDKRKWKLHVNIMTYVVAAFARNGIVTVAGPDHDGLALWLPPGKQIDGLWTILRSGMWRLYYQLSPEGRKRYYEELLPLLHHTMDEVMGDRVSDFYYLGYIGTKPSARGKGYAKRLILDMAKKADAENRPLYLESSDVKNNTYYAKFGFEFRKEIYFTRGPVPVALYIMVREPRSDKLACSSPDSFHIEKALA